VQKGTWAYSEKQMKFRLFKEEYKLSQNWETFIRSGRSTILWRTQ